MQNLNLDPTIKYTQPYTLPITSLKRFIAIDSTQGTGKTKVISDYIQQESLVLVISHRIALSLQTARRFGFRHYSAMTKSELKSYSGSLVITLDSLKKLDIPKYQNAVVVIDECNQVLRHAMGGTLKGKRENTLLRFLALLKNAKRVVIAEADILKASLQFFANVMDLAQNDFEHIQNDYVHPGRKCTTYSSRLVMDENIRDKLAQNKRLVIATDRKDRSTYYETLIKDQRPNYSIMLINSDTNADSAVLDFLNDPDSNLAKIDVLIFSPSMFTGVDISKKHFHSTFLSIEDDTHNIYDYFQAMQRARNLIDMDYHVYLSNRANWNRKKPNDEILRTSFWENDDLVNDLATYCHKQQKDIIKPELKVFVDQFVAAEEEIQELMVDVSSTFHAGLDYYKFTVTINLYLAGNDVHEEHKRIKSLQKEEFKKLILNARDIDHLENFNIEDGYRKTADDIHAQLRFNYNTYAANINDLKSLLDFKLDDIRLAHFLFSTILPDYPMTTNEMVGHTKLSESKAKDLTSLIQDIEKAYNGIHTSETLSQEELMKFVTIMNTKKKEVKHYLGLNVTQKSFTHPGQLYSKYLKKWLLKSTSKAKRQNKKVHSVLTIDEESRNLMLRSIEHVKETRKH